MTLLTDTCRPHQQNYDRTPQPYVVGSENTPRNRQQGTEVIGGNEDCTPQPFNTWPYPAGGNPTKRLSKPPSDPVGQSVSIAAK